jgi:anhydro-N-acetylmuramic acid kinase
MQAAMTAPVRPLVKEPIWALGLMSGTSLDGVDAALIRTDGEAITDFGPALTVAYDGDLRERIRGVLGADKLARASAGVARAVTLAHVEAVRILLTRSQFPIDELKVIGFHGHTILHRPDAGITRQIGDGGLLARLTGYPVINDFRTADVTAGGQGAPLVPLFHRALAAKLPLPLAVLNLGGVGNVTWIGSCDGDEEILAFDTGPGNALIDDWVRRHTGRAFDENGAIAASGALSRDALEALLANPFFGRRPPKSLDRNHFNITVMAGLPVNDGAATLAAFTAAAVAHAQVHLPAAPKQWLVCGGGRHNAALMTALRAALSAPVEAVETVGWDGDALEAQAFGFLAVRSLRSLPLSLPRTTGVRQPMAGGKLHLPTQE